MDKAVTLMAGREFEEIVPELLPPSEDGVFKTLLTHPDAKPVLRDVISSVLQIPVIDVEVKNVELPISDIGEKRERLDVNCKVDGDKQADVEMQTEAMKGDSIPGGHRNIKNRAIYYLCDLHASQEGHGVSYDKLLHSYQITFCGYTVFPEREVFISRFSFRDENGAELSDSVGIVFIELSKLGTVMKKPVEDMTAMEMWAIFFGHASEPEHREILNKMIAAKGEIKLASELLTSISKDEVERAHFRSRRMYRMDMEHDRAVILDERNREVVKNAFMMGLTIEQIEKLTKLSRAEIEALHS
jgi:predicted transposase/invertase (TIGR01784 family)